MWMSLSARRSSAQLVPTTLRSTGPTRRSTILSITPV
ncbi:hypothetical protein FOIG_16973 [Fusarium odoratissimum NRRL 54006]|uniref:Uncharacterized protein n=1 Tax=Fusarium odoratissimum (strain NRRL 54006) TaxID=1089451 RepID=X0ILK5_FUSO5|nr:uncharacterized protein FOIG_16973 [Fusarium odoratissimum NRRL 54006]EXL89742.1 hypothetical protein FOIG_16973 [Fusarium odoratissimum NRRL 54006]